MLAAHAPVDEIISFYALADHLDEASGWYSGVQVSAWGHREDDHTVRVDSASFSFFAENLVTGLQAVFGFGDLEVETLFIPEDLSSFQLACTGEGLDITTGESAQFGLDLSLAATGPAAGTKAVIVDSDGRSAVVTTFDKTQLPMDGHVRLDWLTPTPGGPIFPTYPTLMDQSGFFAAGVEATKMRSEPISPAMASTYMNVPADQSFGPAAAVSRTNWADYTAFAGGHYREPDEPLSFGAYVTNNPEWLRSGFEYRLHLRDRDPWWLYAIRGQAWSDGGASAMTYTAAADGSAASLHYHGPLAADVVLNYYNESSPYRPVQTDLDLHWSRGAAAGTFQTYLQVTDSIGTHYSWGTRQDYDAVITGSFHTDEPGFTAPVTSFRGNIEQWSQVVVDVPAGPSDVQHASVPSFKSPDFAIAKIFAAFSRSRIGDNSPADGWGRELLATE